MASLFTERNTNSYEMIPLNNTAQSPHGQPQEVHTLNFGNSKRKKPKRLDQLAFSLHIIKWIAMVFIALCVLSGTVFSKISLVSITGRMFNLTRSPDGPNTQTASVLFTQLTLMLIIPEVVSFIRCLVWGVIGKTTSSFPWPSRSALFLVSYAMYVRSYI